MEVALLLITAILAVVNAQDFAFPGLEQETPGKTPNRLTVSKKNSHALPTNNNNSSKTKTKINISVKKENRIPLHIPGRCPPNQLLYPGDQEHDWVCDCGPGFVYYPPQNGCFLAYRQGPCNANQHLILPKNKVVPECVDNPCRDDGFVRYQSKCYQLDKSGGPCKPASEGGGVFGVNTTTLALECLSDPDKLSLINFPPNCPPGSRRGATNCRPEY